MEIKLRFWNDSKLVYGPTDDNLNPSWVLAFASLGYPSEIFTGLLDKDGKEIYIGDILEEEEDLDKDCCYDDVTTYIAHRAVFFNNGVFSHDENNLYNLSINSSNGQNMFVRVVGNIHENPELLK